MQPEQLEQYLHKLPAESPPAQLSQRIQQTIKVQCARRVVWERWRRVFSTSLGALAAIILLVWASVETVAAWQVGGVDDFADLFSGHPELVAQYPGEAFSALLESLPITNMLLLLGAGLVVVLLVSQLGQALQNEERGPFLYR